MSLELLGAAVFVGELGDDYLKGHPEIPRDPSGVPTRGMLVPLSSAERSEWQKMFGTLRSVVYRGPSAAELRRRDQAGLNDAERYWLAQDDGDQARAQAYIREGELRLQRDITELDLRIARMETEQQQQMRYLAEGGGKDPFGDLKKYLPWILGGAGVIVAGVVVLPVVVPLLARRALAGGRP